MHMDKQMAILKGYHQNTCIISIIYLHYKIHKNKIHKGKGKAVLLQAWSGPEGSRKLRFLDFMTTAHKK